MVWSSNRRPKITHTHTLLYNFKRDVYISLNAEYISMGVIYVYICNSTGLKQEMTTRALVRCINIYI